MLGGLEVSEVIKGGFMEEAAINLSLGKQPSADGWRWEWEGERGCSRWAEPPKQRPGGLKEQGAWVSPAHEGDVRRASWSGGVWRQEASRF